jgi:hypothetical protein
MTPRQSIQLLATQSLRLMNRARGKDTYLIPPLPRTQVTDTTARTLLASVGNPCHRINLLEDRPINMDMRMDRTALILTVTGEFAGDEGSSYRPSSAGIRIEAYLVRRVLSVP